MVRWGLRYLTHLLAVVAFSVISEGVGKVSADGLAIATGQTVLELARGYGAGAPSLIAALIQVAPFLIGVFVALPAYRVLSSIAWPERTGWAPLIRAGAALVVLAWLARAAALNGFISLGEMSLLLFAVLLTGGFAVTVRAQAQALRLQETRAVDAFK